MLREFRYGKMPVDMTPLPSHVDSIAAHNRLGQAYGFSPAAWITLRVIHRSTGTTNIFKDEGISYFRQKTV